MTKVLELSYSGIAFDKLRGYIVDGLATEDISVANIPIFETYAEATAFVDGWNLARSFM